MANIFIFIKNGKIDSQINGNTYFFKAITVSQIELGSLRYLDSIVTEGHKDS